jgi:hypothetical protein
VFRVFRVSKVKLDQLELLVTQALLVPQDRLVQQARLEILVLLVQTPLLQGQLEILAQLETLVRKEKLDLLGRKVSKERRVLLELLVRRRL